MADEVVLLNSWSSPYGMRVLIALAEKGIKYECKEEDLRNKSPLLLQMNPVYKKIPVLIHNGKPVCESLIAIQYIDEVWKDKSPLLPSDPSQKSQARFWADYIDKQIYEIALRIWKTKGEEQEASKKEFLECLQVLEKQLLGNKPYFGGDNFGLVDIVLVPLFRWFYAYETSGDFIKKGKCPNIIEWAKRCMQRQSVIRSLPDQDKVNDYILQWKKEWH